MPLKPAHIQQGALENTQLQLEVTKMLLEATNQQDAQLSSESLLLLKLAEQFEMAKDDLLNLLPSLGLTLEALDALDFRQLALLCELLSIIRNDLSLTEFLSNLDDTGFLYECAEYKFLYISSKLLLDEESLFHTCKEHAGYSKTLGRFRLIAAGSADRLQHWAHSKMLRLDRPFAGP